MDDSIVERLKAQLPAITELQRSTGAPGLSLGVFRHGRIIYTTHLGRRATDAPEPPDDESIYTVASTFKIVTASAIAALVTGGVLGWDVPVREYLPQLKRKDDFGLRATIRDLLSNRTGLPMASFYWGQMNGEELLDKSEIVHIVDALPAVRPFRSTFIYSQWNYCLLQLVVEQVTRKPFGDYARETIFEPLGLRTPTFDISTSENTMKPHASRDDGTICRITASDFSSSSGLAAGVGGKSGLRDQLILYIALLHAYRYQSTHNVDVTPNSPFTHLRTIFKSHIKIPGSQLDSQAYCLGIYRTKLPGNLSCASLNSSLPREEVPIFGKSGGYTEEIFHHTANAPGSVGAIFLVPRTYSGVVVMANATPRCDGADFAAQLLLSVLLDTEPPLNLLHLSKNVFKVQLSWWAQLKMALENFQTDILPTHPLAAYEGDYFNALRNFRIEVRCPGTTLRVSIQGKPLTTYTLMPCDGDTFYWAANREQEIVEKGMWFNPIPQYHLVHFHVDKKSVRSLAWQFDRQMETEVFSKISNEGRSKL